MIENNDSIQFHTSSFTCLNSKMNKINSDFKWNAKTIQMHIKPISLCAFTTHFNY